MEEGRTSEPAAGGHAPHHDEDLDHDHHVLGSNALMREVWDGEVGRFWVEETDRYEQMNAGFGVRLLGAASAQSGERFLDIGCGHGARTLDIASAVGPEGRVVGVDISGPMLEVARSRAAHRGLTQAMFRQADAQADSLGAAQFDGIVSQFGVMFFADPRAAFANLRAALRDGGRLVFTCWQDLGRQQRIMVPVTAALEHIPLPDFDETSWSHAAFSLADPDRIQSLLTTAGFANIVIEPLQLPEYQGRDVDDVVAFSQRTELAEVLFSQANPEQTARGWDAIAKALEPHATTEGVFLDGAAWLVRAEAGH